MYFFIKNGKAVDAATDIHQLPDVSIDNRHSMERRRGAKVITSHDIDSFLLAQDIASDLTKETGVAYTAVDNGG